MEQLYPSQMVQWVTLKLHFPKVKPRRKWNVSRITETGKKSNLFRMLTRDFSEFNAYSPVVDVHDKPVSWHVSVFHYSWPKRHSCIVQTVPDLRPDCIPVIKHHGGEALTLTKETGTGRREDAPLTRFTFAHRWCGWKKKCSRDKEPSTHSEVNGLKLGRRGVYGGVLGRGELATVRNWHTEPDEMSWKGAWTQLIWISRVPE